MPFKSALGLFTLARAHYLSGFFIWRFCMTKESFITEGSMVFDICHETHVFPNNRGGVTIRQIDSIEGDSFIYIPIFHIEKFILALRSAKHDILSLDD